MVGLVVPPEPPDPLLPEPVPASPEPEPVPPVEPVPRPSVRELPALGPQAAPTRRSPTSAVPMSLCMVCPFLCPLAATAGSSQGWIVPGQGVGVKGDLAGPDRPKNRPQTAHPSLNSGTSSARISAGTISRWKYFLVWSADRMLLGSFSIGMAPAVRSGPSTIQMDSSGLSLRQS